MTPIVYVGGNFDLFHAGHVNFLSECCRYGRVIVSLNTDEFAAAYKRPTVMSFEERREVVDACRHVYTVIVNTGGADSKPALEVARPRYIAHGTDWSGPALMKQMGVTPEWLAERRISFVYIPYTVGISSSDIIERIRGTA